MAPGTTSRVPAESRIRPAGWRRLLELGTDDLLALQAKFARVHRSRGSPAPIGFCPVVDGTSLPSHPLEPTSPVVSRDRLLMVGWNEGEYTFSASRQRDTRWIHLAGLRAKLEPRFGAATGQILETRRQSRPSATPADVYVAVQPVAIRGVRLHRDRGAQAGGGGRPGVPVQPRARVGEHHPRLAAGAAGRLAGHGRAVDDLRAHRPAREMWKALGYID